MSTPLARAARATSVCQSAPITEASGVPPRARTTATMRRAHGWTAPTKPAARVSSTAILQLSTRPRGRSVNRVCATNRARVRVEGGVFTKSGPAVGQTEERFGDERLRLLLLVDRFLQVGGGKVVEVPVLEAGNLRVEDALRARAWTVIAERPAGGIVAVVDDVRQEIADRIGEPQHQVSPRGEHADAPGVHSRPVVLPAGETVVVDGGRDNAHFAHGAIEALHR